MKTIRSTIVVGIAALLATLVAATAATAAGPSGKTLFRYVGKLDGKTATSVTVTVQNGNRPALHSMLGKSQQEMFTTGDKTVFLKWTDGIPKQVTMDDLVIGDYVAVNVRGERDASLATIASTPAGIVADHGATLTRPDKPLYLFRGAFVSTGTDSVTIDVKGGNRRALKLMIGPSGSTQTFTTGADTVFLCWAKRIPTVIEADKLKDCGRIVIRIRAAAGLSLADVEKTPATRVAGHEPRAQETSQNTQS